MRFIEISKKGFIEPGCLKAVFENIIEKTEHKFSPEKTNKITELAKKQQLSVKYLFESLVVDLLLNQIDTDEISKVRWVEKTPGHIFQMDIIHKIYPNAKFIEIIRNPLNAIYSAKTKFHDIDHITPVALAHRWKRGIDVFNQFTKGYPEQTYSVKYEALVSNSEKEFGELYNFLGITPDIEKLRQIQKSAKRLVLDREKHKTKNLNNEIINNQHNYKWSLKERLKISYLLKDELIKIGYANSQLPSQRIFNKWMVLMSDLTKIKLLNLFKKPVKYLVQKIGFWPYQT